MRSGPSRSPSRPRIVRAKPCSSTPTASSPRAAQNYLDEKHIDKIVTAYQDYADEDGLARVVHVAELAENDFNLNIRRCAANTPGPSRRTSTPTCTVESIQVRTVLKNGVRGRCESFSRFAESASGRSGIPEVSRHELEKFAVRLPSIADQQRIEEILDSADDAIRRSVCRWVRAVRCRGRAGVLIRLSLPTARGVGR